MNVGDLCDQLDEKLKTGEFSRIDDLDIEGYGFSSIEKVSASMVRIYAADDLPDCGNCFEESDNEDLAKFREQFDELRELLDEAEEINMANYDVDQVAALNNFYIEVYKILENKPDAAA